MSSEPSDLESRAARIADVARTLASAARMSAADSADDANRPHGAGESGGADTAPRLAAVRIASEIAALSGSALRLSVERARAAGHTWQELGDLLGVSRQAAFQRFGRPIDPRTGEPMSNAVLPQAGARATDLLIDWIEGRYEEVVADFDATMTQELPADKLAAAWAQLIGLVGVYERMEGEPLVRQLGDYTVVDVPMSFESAEMKGRVAYNADGQVAGLFVLTPETL